VRRFAPHPAGKPDVGRLQVGRNSGRDLTHAVEKEELSIMQDKPIKTPGPDHPITVEPNTNRIVVSVDGKVIADTRAAVTLREASYPAVQYIPREDADMSLLERTDHTTYCPYKGDCSYYSVLASGNKLENVVWTYDAPYPAVAVIQGRLAFYSDRVDVVEEP